MHLAPLTCKKIQIGAKGFVDLKTEDILCGSYGMDHIFKAVSFSYMIYNGINQIDWNEAMLKAMLEAIVTNMLSPTSHTSNFSFFPIFEFWPGYNFDSLGPKVEDFGVGWTPPM